MLRCREVTRTIASDELSSAGWRRRLAVRLHLFMCRHCRRYADQMREIGEAAREVLGPVASESRARERLRKSILDRWASGRPEEPDPPV